MVKRIAPPRSVGLLAVLLSCASAAALAAQAANPDLGLLKGLQYRSIGPYRGGRVTAVTGVPAQPFVYYFGATGGGVFKTTDAGVNWTPVSDGQFGTGSVGAIAVSESDPNILYAGMGESPIRGNVSHGDGIYKSTDAGKTWKKSGLEDSRQIARIRVHPRNPDLVYVAALGHVFGPNEQRGVFRSRDGGKSWDRVLFRGNRAGAIDLVLDPGNPNIVYAGFWEVYRTPYSLESGGPGSGLLKSTDGGDSWTDLTRRPGLPKGVVGKVGIAVSPANPERLWAIVEAADGGVFRSDNGGGTWLKVNEDRRLRQRAWYYSRIYADPKNPESVYVLNTGFYHSNDGGRTYSSIPVPHGDNHDLWLSPQDPNIMIESNDGGANVTFNGGRSWSEQDQATAQFYRVALDNDFPYNIYGAQQDNSTVKIPSRTMESSIDQTHWYDVGGGESGWIAPDPRNSNIIYAGSYGGLITRYDHRTGQQTNVTVWPDNPMGAGAEALKYRFQWNFPIVFSAHAPHALYAAGNVLFRSLNGGQSWEAISGDLTRNDKSKQGSSGGPITKDNTSVEYYCTIFTLAESPLAKGTLWTGSDDGLVQLTRNEGKSWENVTPKEIPEWIQINSIEGSPHDPAAAYVAATMYKSDDLRPYLYKTGDYGKSWKKITRGIPDNAFTRVIREDPQRRGLLYAGTEIGMFVSFDDGENWQSLQLNLPVVPITDLAVHPREKDLVVATQGRSFWILDDLPLLHQLAAETVAAETMLFKPESAYRLPGGGGFSAQAAAAGQNPPAGAPIFYYLKGKPAGDITLEILDSTGNPIREFSSKAADSGGAAPAAAAAAEEGGFSGAGADPRLPAEAGLNRFVWDLRCSGSSRFPGLILWAGVTQGPRAVPGGYQIRLKAEGKTYTESLEIRKDPRLETTQADYVKQFELLLKIRNQLTETHDAVVRIRDIRKQVDEVVNRAKDLPAAGKIAEPSKGLRAQLTAVEEELYQTKNQSSQDPLNFPIRLNNKLAALAGVVGSGDAAPTAQGYLVFDELSVKIDAQLNKLKQLVEKEVPAFNKLVGELSIPAILVKEPVSRKP